MKLSLLLQTLDRTLKGPDEDIRAICDDSRACGPGSLFVCHDAAKDYVAAARANGAVAVITTAPADDDCYVVPDTRQAYAASIIRLPSDAISAFKSPTAFSVASERRELEQHSSANRSV